MPRKRRFVIPGIPLHIVQRGHCRNPVFFEDEDYSAYLGWLKKAAKRYQCSVHAYVLMTNHVHFLVTPNAKLGVARMMQYVGRYYVSYINKKYGRSGSLWEGRYKASLVQEETYLLSCMRYIELNPVNANMVKTPEDYRWSSYQVNGLGRKNALITPHLMYMHLGRYLFERLSAYRALFHVHIDVKEQQRIRTSCQTGTPLGNDYFREKVERVLKQKIGQIRRGRPRKEK